MLKGTEKVIMIFLSDGHELKWVPYFDFLVLLAAPGSCYGEVACVEVLIVAFCVMRIQIARPQGL